jgi:hypothetical protein
VLVCDKDSSPIRVEQLAYAAIFFNVFEVQNSEKRFGFPVAAAGNSKSGNYLGGSYDVLPQLGIRNRKYTQEKLSHFILLLDITVEFFSRRSSNSCCCC